MVKKPKATKKPRKEKKPSDKLADKTALATMPAKTNCELPPRLRHAIKPTQASDAIAPIKAAGVTINELVPNNNPIAPPNAAPAAMPRV